MSQSRFLHRIRFRVRESLGRKRRMDAELEEIYRRARRGRVDFRWVGTFGGVVRLDGEPIAYLHHEEPDGWVLIPAGDELGLSIARVAPPGLSSASADRARDGALRLVRDQVCRNARR